MADERQKVFAKSPIAAEEENVLKFWRENRIFEKTLAKSSRGEALSFWQRLFGHTAEKKEFVFYEGPPTANAKPGIHHLEARAFKDLIPRYKTMRGYYVRRKAGWDTHGLPVEIQVEKALGLATKKDVEKFGVAEFNKKCKESVLTYISEWREFTDRIGFWLDHDDAYFTFDPEYMETLWWIVKHINERGLLYKDYKVVPWCPRCGTALSSHEVAQGYEDVTDRSVYVKFKVKNPKAHDLPENTYLLAWTTTPWTLPGNVALAVGENIEYVGWSKKGSTETETYIIARQRFNALGVQAVSVGTWKGIDLVGLEYEPLYPFLRENISGPEKEKLTNAYKVYPADFVSTEDGTSIVHTAVMYGAEDFELGTSVGLPKYHLVSPDGTFTEAVKPWAGKFVKDKEVEGGITEDLKARGLLFKEEPVTHTYPFCWRCKTPLLYYARDSWYVKMSALRDELVRENAGIHWEPEHIRDGRFGEWLREVKDWAFSRERYWGTPLPVWECEKCGMHRVIGSLEELAAASPARNTYTIMRHGEAEQNLTDTVSVRETNPHRLTERGKEEVLRTADTLLKSGSTDVIISSRLLRCRETAELLAEQLGISIEQIVYDDRLRELEAGVFEGRTWAEYQAFFANTAERFIKAPEGGETLADVKRRAGSFLYELESHHSGKRILVVTHDAVTNALLMVARAATLEGSVAIKDAPEHTFRTGEARPLSFTPLPHNTDYELDLHRPFIDAITLTCACGGTMRRVPEVVDVWFDSGSMPFAQDHYPFDFAENKPFEDQKLQYPADFISEAIDQTRGWFYTLHAVGTLLGRGKAYKNVICLGHILDAEGKKMSKSVGNVVNPFEMIEKYGVDALRFWMYSVNQPGESKNFDERTVDELVKKVMMLLLNVVRFYEMYAPSNQQPAINDQQPKHVLDRWILTRLNQLIADTMEHLDAYRITEPARDIKDFINDFSTWYLRRSRERFKGRDTNTRMNTNGEDREAAIATTRFVLLELSKLIAPFMPFLAERVYKSIGGEKESVHLAEWPAPLLTADDGLLTTMQEVRKIVSLGLEARAKAGIKIRQPLQKLKVKGDKMQEELVTLIKDELNVKDVVFNKTIAEDVELDTTITPELKREGQLRELIRAIQEFRKESGLQAGEKVLLLVRSNNEGRALVKKFREDILRAATLSDLTIEQGEGDAVTDEIPFSFGLK